MVSDLTDLRLADDRLRSLVANLNDAIIIVGDDERVVWASPSIFGVSGATADAVVGQQLFDTVHPEDVAELRDAWEVARRNPGVPSEEFETRGRRADGSLAWYRGTFYDMRHDPAIAGTVVTFRNVTAAHEAAQARRELLRRLDVAEEAERRRLAEDLHDGPVQELAALALRLGTLRLGLTDDTERARRVGEIEARVRESVRKLRTLMFDLHPPELAEHGLAASLRSCAAMVFGEMHDGVRVRDRLAHEPPERVSLTAYRIAREALVNARRHANATRVDVELDATESCLRVSVTDDGKGLPGEVLAHGAPGHFGLRTMCERAEAAGGSLRVENVRGGGARVSVSLPLAEPAAS
jgi:PAS domain S-box-containing protein